jgi:hypothetical protein
MANLTTRQAYWLRTAYEKSRSGVNHPLAPRFHGGSAKLRRARRKGMALRIFGR